MLTKKQMAENREKENQRRREWFRHQLRQDPELADTIRETLKWMRHLGEFRAPDAVSVSRTGGVL